MCITMMDGQDRAAKSEKADKLSIHAVKHLKLDAARKVLHGWPVIPLVGDMTVSTYVI